MQRMTRIPLVLIVLALTAILLRAVINLVVRRGFSWYWLA